VNEVWKLESGDQLAVGIHLTLKLEKDVSDVEVGAFEKEQFP